MKKILLSVVAFAAMLFAPTSADAQSKSLVYNFAALAERVELEFLNGGSYYVWYNDANPDMLRYNFRGYQNYEGDALDKECHVWRYGDNLNGNLTPQGLLCPKDREMVVDGLSAGSVVKVTYDDSGVSGSGAAKQLLYITGASAGTVAEVGGNEAVAGKTAIASGAEIVVSQGEYVAFQVKKGMVISSIEVSSVVLNYENGTTVKSDFAAEANTFTQPANLNGSNNNGQEFYVWASEGAPNRNRNQYKGYTWAEGLKLPEVCNVWRTSDRINGNIIAGGLNCPNDREFIVSGLENGSEVTITFDASKASTKELLWVPGTEVALEATVNGENAVIAETTIASGTPIKVVSTEKGYVAVKVFKGMIISKVVIKNAAETLTYDFTALKSKLTGLNGSAARGQAFYVWERTDKADSYRQDFKGYQSYTGNNLPADCQVWRRSERFDQDATLANGGLNFTGDRETVINGLKEGDVVKIKYDATNASTKELLYATGASAKVVATVNGAEAVSGVTTIPSEAEIKIVSTENGYFGFKTMKGMVILSVEVLSPAVENQVVNNDFAAAGVVIPVQPDNLNGSTANGQKFYIWESDSKTNSLRQDYKGYKWVEGLALPEVCHVWRRSDRINGNIVPGGLKCPNDRDMVIDGLEDHCTVIINYDATNAADKELLYVLSPESKTQAQVNYARAISGETKIKSGDDIEIPYTEDGYIAVKVKKGMLLTDITIKYYNATGIESVNAAAEGEGAWYNLQGVRVAAPAKGVYIRNGKKVVVK